MAPQKRKVSEREAGRAGWEASQRARQTRLRSEVAAERAAADQAAAEQAAADQAAADQIAAGEVGLFIPKRPLEGDALHILFESQLAEGARQVKTWRMLTHEEAWWSMFPDVNDRRDSLNALLDRCKQDGVRLLLAPVNHHNAHWSLLVFDTTISRFFHLDSLQENGKPRDSNSQDAKNMAQAFWKLTTGTTDGCRMETLKCSRQYDSYSCGDFSAIHAAEIVNEFCDRERLGRSFHPDESAAEPQYGFEPTTQDVVYRLRAELHFLEKVELFKRFPKEELPTLVKASGLCTFEPDTTIIAQGDESNEFFVIKSGTAKVEVNGNMVATLKTGDYFGENALLRGDPHNASIICQAKIDALKITRKAFSDLGLNEKLEKQTTANNGGTPAPTAAPGSTAGTGVGLDQVAPPLPPEALILFAFSGVGFALSGVGPVGGILAAAFPWMLRKNWR